MCPSKLELVNNIAKIQKGLSNTNTIWYCIPMKMSTLINGCQTGKLQNVNSSLYYPENFPILNWSVLLKFKIAKVLMLTYEAILLFKHA